MLYYYCVVDEKGIMCVDQIEDSSDEAVQKLAVQYPEVTYFGVE